MARLPRAVGQRPWDYGGQVSDRVAVIADPSLSAYNFGQGHPMAPIRVQLALRLAEDFGLLQVPNVDVIREVEPAGVHDLVKVHVPDFLTAVRTAGHTGDPGDPKFGMGTDDVPVFPRMHEAAAHLCGATIRAVEEVHSGRSQHAVNLFGGMHHAMADRAAGFCVYNDVGVAIRWLLDRGVQRVAYIDVDAHHGDGVQAMFYDDPRVLTISLHESGRTLFPGTGWPGDIGAAGAEGTAVNVALPAGTADNQWLRAFNAVVPLGRGGVRPRLPGQPARLRLALRGRDGPPAAQRGRPAHVLLRRASAGPSPGRWTLGRRRRRRI